MKQLWYSDTCHKYFDTEEECVKAEAAEEEKLAAAKKEREEKSAKAKEVTDAYKKYLELRSEFIKTYGSWHATLTEKDLPATTGTSIWDLFNEFWF